MTDWEDEITRHTVELVNLTLVAADRTAGALPEDEVARLGVLIATARQLLVDAVSGLLREEEPEAAERPGVAEFDAGFRYGLEFARAIDDVRFVLERERRGRLLKLVRATDGRSPGDSKP
jgi:hypothetical protein